MNLDRLCGMVICLFAIVSGGMLGLFSPVVPQAGAAGPAAPPVETPAERLADDLRFSPAAFTASLVDAERNSRQGAAVIKVDITRDVRLVNPDETTGKPVSGEGHLHYQLDDGPVIATTANKLGFHGLDEGNHLVKVILVGNDHKPISPLQKINLRIASP